MSQIEVEYQDESDPHAPKRRVTVDVEKELRRRSREQLPPRIGNFSAALRGAMSEAREQRGPSDE